MHEHSAVARRYHSLLRIRRVEEALAKRYAEQEMRCPMHLCIGQEAIAVGVCEVLRKSDPVFSGHRAHGHYLAKGGDLNAMLAELYGRVTGCCGGRGGSMHLIDLNAGFLGSTPIVGGTLPLAVGSAWAASLQRTGQVTTVFFGDGCFEEGVMHEALNFAALHRLPVVFVCENNGFSVYTKLNHRQPHRPIYALAAAHGVTAFHGDGNDVEAVLGIATKAVAAARAGQGPQFLELETYRWREHCGPNFDHELGYRTSIEIEHGMKQCPLAAYTTKLRQRDMGFARQAVQFEQEIASEVAAAFDFALAGSKPTAADAGDKLYA